MEPQMSASLENTKSSRSRHEPLGQLINVGSKVHRFEECCLKHRTPRCLLSTVCRGANTCSIFLCAPFAVFVYKANYGRTLTCNWLKSALGFDKIVINRNKLRN